jgi:hypothetical protein
MPTPRWLAGPEDHNYPAALSYLSLLLKKNVCIDVVKRLKEEQLISNFKAKDIFRASGLSLLGVSNSHVTKDQTKIRNRTRLSPILLVRDTVNRKVIIADGYHRLCAVYSCDEDAIIPCKIVTL